LRVATASGAVFRLDSSLKDIAVFSRIIERPEVGTRPRLEAGVAKKTIHISDMSGAAIPDGKGASVRISFHDARKGVRELDVTDAEAEKLGGRSVARRGRKPKAAA
jgi:hypothetical protein